MVISRVTHGSHMRKSGMWSMTLSSHLILPASTSVASAALVKALPVDPVKKIVSASTGRLVRDVAHAPAMRQRDLAVLDDGDGDAGHAPCLAKLFHALLEPGRRRGRRGRSEQRPRRRPLSAN